MTTNVYGQCKGAAVLVAVMDDDLYSKVHKHIEKALEDAGLELFENEVRGPLQPAQ